MMANLLDPSNRTVLEQLGWARTLVALDFDGTLAPIVADPAKARMRTSTRELLRGVASRYPCVIVSGRAQADAQLGLEGVPVRAVLGNHGLEPWVRAHELERPVQRWRTTLERLLASQPGIVLEDKRYSLALHYRAAPSERAALDAIRSALASIDGARIVGGKCVVNVVPAGAPHKGDAVVRLREAEGCDTALFVGDDETDEDVFRMAEPGRLLGVRVGESSTSAASYYLTDQTKIDELLELLLEARPTADAVREEAHVHGL